MLRKLLGVGVEIHAQTVMKLGRYEDGARLPGHADRAAKALAIAKTMGYPLLVFVKDVDRTSATKKSDRERRTKLASMHAEIKAGFGAVADADAVLRIKATPCRMIEAWALGDPAALAQVGEKRQKREPAPKEPETLWGPELDPLSDHPKCVLRRCLGKEANTFIFEELAHEGTEKTLRASCPESFAPFADEVANAARALARR